MRAVPRFASPPPSRSRPPPPRASPATGARAQDAGACTPQVKAEVPIQRLQSLAIVRLAVRGAPLNLVLDTGAEETLLVESAAKRIGVAIHTAYPRQVQGMGGGVTTGDAVLSPLTAGGVTLPDAHVVVAPVTLPDIGGQPTDGLLGADVLSDFDIELNVAQRRLTLFARRTCTEPPSVWKPPFATLEANRSLHNRLFFPVTLDGHALAAFIDTGAQGSVVDAKAAAAIGVSARALAADPSANMRGVASSAQAFHRHTFGQIVIGGLTLRSPALVVAPFTLADADIILGMDFLAGRKIWFSYGAHRIFIAQAQ